MRQKPNYALKNKLRIFLSNRIIPEELISTLVVIRT